MEGSSEFVRFVMGNAIAPSTAKQYERRWNEWQRYCDGKGIRHFEPDVTQFLEYLGSLGEQNSVNVVYSHLSAVNYYHRLELLPSPSHSEHVSMFMRGLKRIELTRNPARETRARPITPEILLKLRQYLDSHSSLKNFRTVWRVFVCYYCMLRWDDVQKLQRDDVLYDDDEQTYRLKIRSGKTGMHSQPPDGLLTVVENPLLCPVRLTCDYLDFLGPHQGSMQPTCSAANANVAHPTRVVVYSNALRDLRSMLSELGEPGHLYGEHSMRRGGATQAANRGLTDQQILQTGNWTNLRTANVYVEPNTRMIRRFNNELAQFQPQS